MMRPYPRISVLHVSVMIGFAAVISGVMLTMSATRSTSPARRATRQSDGQPLQWEFNWRGYS